MAGVHLTRFGRGTAISVLSAAALSLAACETDGLTQAVRPVVAGTAGQANGAIATEPTYSLFFAPSDHIAELVAAKKYEQAAEVFDKNAAWFDHSRINRYYAQLRAAADGLNDAYSAELAAGLSEVERLTPTATPNDWSLARAILGKARARLAAYDRFGLARHSQFRSPIAVRLAAALDKVTQRYASLAVSGWRQFEHISGRLFFEEYPVPLDARQVLAENASLIPSTLAGARSRDLESFARTYLEKGWLDDRLSQALATLYVDAHVRDVGGRRDFRAVVEGMRKAEGIGLKTTALPGVRLAFVEATSQTLLRKGQIEFPPQVELDMPFEAEKVELDKAMTDPEAPEFLVVFDVALAKTSRRVNNVEKIGSRVLTGMRREPNPQFEVARMKLLQAEMEASRAQMYGGLAGLIAVIAASNQRKEAESVFKATPQMIDVPVYNEYQFDRATVDATRTMTVHYYILDRHARSYYKSTFDIKEQQRFQVAYNVADKDPDKAQVTAGMQSESDLAKWEEAPMTIKLSQLVDNYLKGAPLLRRLPSLGELRDEIVRDKNIALARVEAETFKGSTQNDSRFDSVVQIFTGRRVTGSGFYVAPDIVMTNYHVVEGSQFVEMKLYGGMETFGRVLHADPHLDLAVIRVQARGKPVRFYQANKLELGTTLDIIGHPRSYDFTITRGIVSAIRPMKSLNIPGAKELLVVQTDAAANPGNSGGPMFVRDEVVGVVSYGRRGAEGLSFGTHYSEALKYLRENKVIE